MTHDAGIKNGKRKKTKKSVFRKEKRKEAKVGGPKQTMKEIKKSMQKREKKRMDARGEMRRCMTHEAFRM